MKYNLYKIYSTTRCFNFKIYDTESLQQWAFCFSKIKKKKNLSQVLDKAEKVGIIERVKKAHGPLVKGLRHRLFTAVTRVRIPYGLWVYRG